jgi:hypothetical protein
MHGLPHSLVAQLGDRIVGSEMGGLKLTPPVDERISDLAERTAKIGEKIIVAHGAKIDGERLSIIPSGNPARRAIRSCRFNAVLDRNEARRGFSGTGSGWPDWRHHLRQRRGARDVSGTKLAAGVAPRRKVARLTPVSVGSAPGRGNRRLYG